jgi:hypothetical protein
VGWLRRFQGDFDGYGIQRTPRFHATLHHLLAVLQPRHASRGLHFPVKFKAMSGVKNHGNDQGLHWTDQRLFLIGFA